MTDGPIIAVAAVAFSSGPLIYRTRTLELSPSMVMLKYSGGEKHNQRVERSSYFLALYFFMRLLCSER